MTNEERLTKLEEALAAIATQNEAILKMAEMKAKETAPAAVITQEPKKEETKEEEIPAWFKAYIAANTPAQTQTEEKKADKPKKNWKETAKDVAAVAGVSALALFGIRTVFNAGASYQENQQNLKLLQSSNSGGTIETTAYEPELDLTK